MNKKKIIFILNSIQIQRVVKRINSFCDAGYPVEVFAFSRVGDDPCPLKTHFEYEVIGEFPNQMSYLARLSFMRKCIKAKADNIKKQNAILYIFGLDAAIVTRTVLKTPYVYEEADLVHTYISNGFVSGLLEKLDRRIIRKSLLTVLTSEGFMDYHFGNNRPTNLLEVSNRLNQAVTNFPIQKKKPLDINHLKIGFVGSFRFNAVINFCKVFVDHYPQHELHVFGTMPENSPARVLLEKKNFIMHGPFKNPDDLPGIYSQIDLSLSTYDANTVNARYAEPNKLYEAIYFETPIIASSHTFVADKVKRMGIGFDIDASNDNEVIRFVEGLTEEMIKGVVECIRNIDKKAAINNNTELFKRIDVIVGAK